jgi:hypothetical protein
MLPTDKLEKGIQNILARGEKKEWDGMRQQIQIKY